MRKFLGTLVIILIVMIILAFGLRAVGIINFNPSKISTSLFDIFYEFTGGNYYNDLELRNSARKNSSEPGSIKALNALDFCRDQKAVNFDKKYFDESEETYLYYNKNQKLYLAINDIVSFDKEEHYEIILFSIAKDKTKKIEAKYYVNVLTKQLFDSNQKLASLTEYTDNALGLRVSIPEKYTQNVKLTYLDPAMIKIGDKEAEVRILNYTYLENDISYELFNILYFKGVFSKDNFGIKSNSSEAFYLGSNNNYTFCLKRADIGNNYPEGAVKILSENFSYILGEIEIY